MLRKDRNLVEKMFKKGHLKVLISTSTLAWGVNLPAYCVIIKGTQYFNAEKGGLQDLGILDIQQIFGRAGRPQYDSSGEAVIITDFDKITYYKNLLRNQTPIESTLVKSLEDALNAEIATGAISTLLDAVQWFKYTYMAQRVQKNPRHYGITQEEVKADPGSVEIFLHFASSVAFKLHKAKMIRFQNEYPTNSKLKSFSLGLV
jgi:activating signal cointegrator complex subunit 3